MVSRPSTAEAGREWLMGSLEGLPGPDLGL